MNVWDFGTWERFGLDGNPFFIQPLTQRTMTLFRGKSRETVAKELVTQIRVGESPLLLLEGGPGVGKTSLVNFAKIILDEAQEYYVYPQRIEISAESTRESLAAELLAAMTTTALAVEPQAGWQDDPSWSDAYSAIADTWKQSGLGGGISFAGFGGSLTRTQVAQLAKIMPWETWRALVNNILTALTRQRRGFVVHINNVDAVSDERPEMVQRLFDESRELLILPGLHVILCASDDFRSEVLGDRQRLLDVITNITPIDQLTHEEFLDAVHARYEHFADRGDYTRPVADEALVEVYQVFEGDLRNTFQVAKSAVVQSSLTGTDPEPLSLDDVLALTADSLRIQYEHLPESESAVVDYLLEHGSSPSQSTIIEATDTKQPTVSHATRRLEHKRWLSTRKSGKRREYDLSGYGLLLQRARKMRLL